MSETDLDDAVYRRLDSVVLRQVAGESLLVPIHGEAARIQSIFALTGAGVTIWGLLEDTRTLAAVRDELVRGFDVDAGRAWHDLVAFVGQLEARGLVERVR